MPGLISNVCRGQGVRRRNPVPSLTKTMAKESEGLEEE